MDAFELTAPFETERLVMRPFREDDFEAVFEMQSNPEVARWVPWDARTEPEVRAALKKKIAGTRIRGQGDVLFLAGVLRSTGELVADVVLNVVSEEHATAELGYITHPRHQGQGYATEAARPLLRIAFEEVRLHRVFGRIEPRNVASARVLEKLGMRLEAHFVENEWLKGEWQSERVYAMLDREWQALAT